MVVGVDQYKYIRKMAVEDGLSQREIARRLGISRNTVARYCKGEHMPWEAKDRERKPSVVTGEVEDFIRSLPSIGTRTRKYLESSATRQGAYTNGSVEEKGFPGASPPSGGG